MSYLFARLQDSGHLTSITPTRVFDTKEAAKLAAPDLLASRKGGGKIVLVHIEEVAVTTSTVRYETYGKAMNR